MAPRKTDAKHVVDEVTPPLAVITSLQRSGFPFQTAVADLFRTAKKWSLHASEYPWRDAENKDNFLDIVVVDRDKFVLTIECKKTTKEIFTFLRPIGRVTTGDVDGFECIYTAKGTSNPVPKWTSINI